MSKRAVIITTVWVVLCFPGLIFAETAPTDRLGGIASVVTKNVGSIPSVIYFTQKEEKKPPGNVPVDETVKAGEDAMKPETVLKDKTAPKPTKELKPFIPSEKVPADQGVDFPYDI